ncbi:Glucan-binding domain-containing protein (YG repeat) [Bacillus sp. OV166]|uniref:L,D-transpeptidase family protein n=1 Tax=Bacillus sp. OV166 TaxID=1882763 RepID=UPI000A2AEDDF|nr:L,D-transpeptidase family protein [Bacillus sp. OV166]SMQ58864.1 Glucan-binding domain-containing protein (YG repeat) [Bacillus sp. OV166]
MKKLSIIFVLLFSVFLFTSQADASSGSQLIIINKKTNTLAFYDSGKLVRTFSVATGRSRSLTPEGTFRIVTKIVNRPYYKLKIPGGDPRNPLGNRWLGLEARGTYGTTYAIHGNANENSIGTYASSGCVRMHNSEVRWLYSHVNKYTLVVITHSNSSFDSIAKANGYGSGWVELSGNKYYYVDGQVKTGWQSIDGKRYFFDEAGVMKTGWITQGDKKYYLDNKGEMKTGWLDDNGNRYFLDQTGAMRTGWVADGGKEYYLDNKGVMKTGWLSITENRYYLDSSGAMKTGWLADAGEWYYLDNSGLMKTGWVNSEGRWFYLNGSGVLKNTQALANNSQWDYLDKNEEVTADRSNLLEEKYKLNSQESVVTGWLNYKEKWYYLYVGADMVASAMSEG